MSYYYWGVKLDFGLFDWRGFGLGVGAEYTHSVEGKQRKGSTHLTLEAVNALKYSLWASYDFLESWQVKMTYQDINSDMEASNPAEGTTIFQPESEEDHQLIELRVSKSF